MSIILLLSLRAFSDKPEIQIPTKIIDKYIVYDDNWDCDQCKTGYAVSDDKESCIPFQNCIQLRNGNEYCNECYDGYYINEQGQCEKINRDNCIAKDNIGCSACILDIVNPLLMVNAFYHQHLLKDVLDMMKVEIASGVPKVID